MIIDGETFSSANSPKSKLVIDVIESNGIIKEHFRSTESSMTRTQLMYPSPYIPYGYKSRRQFFTLYGAKVALNSGQLITGALEESNFGQRKAVENFVAIVLSMTTDNI